MKRTYPSAGDALKAALAHAPMHGEQSPLGELLRASGSTESLTADEASAQAGFIRRRLEQLPTPLPKHATGYIRRS